MTHRHARVGADRFPEPEPRSFRLTPYLRPPEEILRLLLPTRWDLAVYLWLCMGARWPQPDIRRRMLAEELPLGTVRFSYPAVKRAVAYPDHSRNGEVVAPSPSALRGVLDRLERHGLIVMESGEDARAEGRREKGRLVRVCAAEHYAQGLDFAKEIAGLNAKGTKGDKEKDSGREQWDTETDTETERETTRDKSRCNARARKRRGRPPGERGWASHSDLEGLATRIREHPILCDFWHDADRRANMIGRVAGPAFKSKAAQDALNRFFSDLEDDMEMNGAVRLLYGVLGGLYRAYK